MSKAVWIAIGASVVGLLAVVRILRRKTDSRRLDAGSVSDQWIAEHRGGKKGNGLNGSPTTREILRRALNREWLTAGAPENRQTWVPGESGVDDRTLTQIKLGPVRRFDLSSVNAVGAQPGARSLAFYWRQHARRRWAHQISTMEVYVSGRRSR